jgi:hypothetical protein
MHMMTIGRTGKVLLAGLLAMMLSMTMAATVAFASPTVARDDHFKVSEDHALIVGKPGLLRNDVDRDGPLSVNFTTRPSHGELRAAKNGSINYVPNKNYHGNDAFNYRACEVGTPRNCGWARVYISISSVNDAPTIGDLTLHATEDKTLSFDAPGVMAAAKDVDGDKLTVKKLSGPYHGTATVNPDGSGSYTPAANYNGTDVMTIEVTDPHVAKAQGQVNIEVGPVNDAPVARPDSYYMKMDTHRTVEAAGVLKNDTDADGDVRSVNQCTQAKGVYVNCYDNGRLGLTPKRGFSGRTSFHYQVKDGRGGYDWTTVTLQVRR